MSGKKIWAVLHLSLIHIYYIMAEITTPTCYEDYKVIRAIKKTNPNVKIIIGGTHATALPQQVMEECPEIDILVRGEYDFTIPEIAQGKALAEIAGISYRNDNEIIHNKDREYQEDLDELPMVSKVYQQFLDVNDYCYASSRAENLNHRLLRECIAVVLSLIHI